MRLPAAAFLVAALACAGCSFERHAVACPGVNQVIRVSSGDRHSFALEEEDGCRWSCTCDDSDVETSIVHDDGKAEVTVRVHRGYDGPSTVHFVCRRGTARTPVRQFTLTLFRRTGDTAFWE